MTSTTRHGESTLLVGRQHNGNLVLRRHPPPRSLFDKGEPIVPPHYDSIFALPTPMPRPPIRPAATTDPASDADWAEYLRANGLRGTRAAIAVLKALEAAALPLSHDELETRTAPIDRVTLYRVLDRLVATGLAQRIESSERAGRYVAVQARADSYFECTTCHRVMALPADPALPQLLSHLRRQLEKQGLESTQTVFRVQGTCADCGADAGKAASARS